MNWDAIGAISETVGALAVVISLIYLARQIRHSTAAERSSAEQEIAGRLTNLFMGAGASELGYIFHVGMKDFSSLEPAEQSKFIFFSGAWFRTIELAHMQFKKGNLDDKIWEGYENYLRMTLNSDTIQKYWKDRRVMFNPEFRDFVDSIGQTPGLITPNEMMYEIRKRKKDDDEIST